MTLRAVIGLGANLGNRLVALQTAVRALAKIGKIERMSRVYETDPVGGPPQPAYLNAAVLFSYDGGAEEVLDALQAIETRLGRVREERWGARAIDLDVLWIEGLAMESERLVVPHPRLSERGFALRPLIDVAPDAVDPETQQPYAKLVAAADLGVRATKMDLSGQN
jgi:2-amino-4-hydroxy-6-hydroxymethyldihydropteridine diphosphokinase